jgi:phosphoesterase RecJ-like protein
MTTNIQASSQAIHSLLLAAKCPLIVSHMRPDGDAIASVLGLGIGLKEAGKQCQMVLTDGIPSKFNFLEGSDLLIKDPQPGYDLVIALDSSDQQRLGEKFSDFAIHINIDHHITNDYFADQNLVLPEEPATSAVLAQFLPQWGFPITPKIASALLTGILTDTIGFRTLNVSPDSLRISAQLIESGANLSDLYEKALVSQTFSASLLWGSALNRLKKKGRLAWTSIKMQDRKEAGYTGRDDADLTNVLSAIENIDISILFNEQNERKIKVSWRSRAGFDVSMIAQRFGGGGHPPASGAEITGNLEEVEEMVLKETNRYLKNKKNSKGEN